MYKQAFCGVLIAFCCLLVPVQAEPILTDAFLQKLLRYCRETPASLPPQQRLEAATLRFDNGYGMSILEAEQFKRFIDVYSFDMTPEMLGMTASEAGIGLTQEIAEQLRAEIAADPELDEAAKAEILAEAEKYTAERLEEFSSMEGVDPADLALFKKYRARFDVGLGGR
jgi:hypothetical protein